MSRPRKLVAPLILLLGAVLLCMFLAAAARGSENLAMALTEGAVASLPVHEGLPPKFTVDGELSEWTHPPSLTLGASNQVAGPSKVQLVENLSARIWIAIAAEGLAIAGEVIDARARFSKPGEIITADRVELWLAFPEAPMPPLAFANQFGETEVPDTTACDNLPLVSSKCKKWVADQTKRRLQLKRLFVHQYLLSPKGIEKAGDDWTPPLVGEDPDPSRPCCGASQSAFQTFDRGYRFEALIAPEDFPATGQVKLSNLKLLVDLIRTEGEIEKLATILSSSAGRQVGHPETFNPVTLKQALSYESDPPLMESLDGIEGLFFSPGRPVAAAYIFKNVPRGYQYEPETPSPSVIKLPLSALPRVATLGDIEVYRAPFAAPEMPSGIGDALWSFRGSKPISKFVFENGEIGSGEGEIAGYAERAPGLHFFLSSTGPLNLLGTGTCGGCLGKSFRVVSMNAAGSFGLLLSKSIAEQQTGEYDGLYGGVEFFAGEALSRFCFKGYGYDYDKWVPFERCWRWDAGSESYVRESPKLTPK